jgi:hypothetical protein
MAPILIMDKHAGIARLAQTGPLQYRLPDDRQSFWTGKFPSTGTVQAFLCGECGRIAFYGDPQDS